MSKLSRLTRTTFVAALCGMLFMSATPKGFAEDCETIDATARGTSTQLGKLINIKLFICGSSTPEDRQTLVAAFKKDKNQGLTDALGKMKAVGRITVPGSVGYQLAYIRIIPTATGRNIRFVTDRKIAFGEAYYATRSLDYSLTAGQLILNDKDKDKSTGDFYPAAALKIDKKKGELFWDLRQNPWKLTNIIDWNPNDNKK